MDDRLDAIQELCLEIGKEERINEIDENRAEINDGQWLKRSFIVMLGVDHIMRKYVLAYMWASARTPP